MIEPDPAGDLVLHMDLVVPRRSGTLSGQVFVDGAPAKRFTGWIGLNAAIDGLLLEQAECGTPSTKTSRPERPLSPKTFDPIHLGPITMTFSVDAEMSNGTATVSRCDVADGAGMPVAHFHDAFEEIIYGVEGQVSFVVDGETSVVGPGDTLCIKRGQVHTFAAASGDCAFLAIATPGVFGPEYFLELADVLSAPGEPDPAAIGAVMMRHGLTPVAP